MPDGGGPSPEEMGLTPQETGSVPESKKPREAVLDAFNSAWTILNNIPEDKLTPEQKSAKKAIQAAKEKTLDLGKDKFENKFEDPDTTQKYSYLEGIPVEALFRVMADRIGQVNVSIDNLEESEKLLQQFELLRKNSKSYLDIDNRKKDWPKIIARVKQEAYFISRDERATGDPKKDYELAMRTIAQRRELIIPENPDTTTEEHPSSPTSESENSHLVEDNPVLPVRDDTADERSYQYSAILARRDIEVRVKARMLAEQRVQWELRRGSKWNPLNIARKIGFRWTEEMHRQRYIDHYSRVMKENNNSNLRLEFVNNAVREVNEKISEERQTGKDKMNELMTRQQEGDLRAKQEVSELQGPAKQLIFDHVLKPLVDGSLPLNNISQIQQKMRDLVNANQNNPDVRDVLNQFFGKTDRDGVADYFAVENLIQTAATIRSDGHAHQFAADHIKLFLANTPWAHQSEVKYNWVDKLMVRGKDSRWGYVLNPTVLGAAASLVTFAGYNGVGKVAVALGMGVGVGSALAAFRRNQELKSDYAGYAGQREAGAEAVSKEQIDQRIQEMDGWQGRLMRTPGMARVMGAYRMSDFESILQRLDTASAQQLRTGGGLESISGENRRSIAELLSADLTVDANQEALVRRITEINSRLDFSTQNKIGLIQYSNKEQIEQERLLFAQDIAKARVALKGVMSEADLQRLESQMGARWEQRFIQTKKDQDRAFFRYRLRNAAGAAAFGGTLGLATGLVGQHLLKEGTEAITGDPRANSILENISQGRPLGETIKAGDERAPGFANDISRELASNPGRQEIAAGIFLESDGAQHYRLLDSTGASLTAKYVEVDPNTGNLLFDGKREDLPQGIKDLLNSDPTWGVIDRPHTIPWNGPELYANGGTEDLGQNISLRVTVEPSGNRLVELIDQTTNTVVPSPPLKIESDGRFIVEQSFDKLSPRLQSLFSQTGWTHAAADGKNLTDFNISKAQEFVQNFRTNGRLGLNNEVDWSIDPSTEPHLGESDHAISFTDKNQKLIDQHPGWINDDGKVIFAGERAQMTPEAQSFFAGMESRETTEHNLRHYLAELAKNGPQNAPDENIKQGNIILNTHDLHTGFLNQDKNPDGSPAHLVYDEFAKKYNRVDPVTGQVEIGKMSFSYKPQDGQGEIWINGFLQQDGKIHVDPKYFVNETYKGNTVISDEQWQTLFGEMKKEGWTVDEANGHYIITPPTATEYTPPTFEAIDPLLNRGTIELVVPPPEIIPATPAVPIIEVPRLPLDALVSAIAPPPQTPPPLPPPPPGVDRPPIYGYYPGRSEGKLPESTTPRSEIDRSTTLMPRLLPAAFDRWGISAEERAIINGLTTAEQLQWMRRQVQNNEPDSPRNLPLDDLAALLGVPVEVSRSDEEDFLPSSGEIVREEVEELERFINTPAEIQKGSKLGESLYQTIRAIEETRTQYASRYGVDRSRIEMPFFVFGNVRENYAPGSPRSKTVTMEEFGFIDFANDEMIIGADTVQINDKGVQRIYQEAERRGLEVIYSGHTHPDSYKDPSDGGSMFSQGLVDGVGDIETIVNTYRQGAGASARSLNDLVTQNQMVINIDPSSGRVSMILTDNRVDGLYTKKGVFNVNTVQPISSLNTDELNSLNDQLMIDNSASWHKYDVSLAPEIDLTPLKNSLRTRAEISARSKDRTESTTLRSKDELVQFIAHEGDSPVLRDPEAVREAVQHAEAFMNSTRDLQAAENAGGLSTIQSANLYKDMLHWKARSDETAIINKDPSFNTALYNQVYERAKLNLFFADELETERITNAVMYFISEYGDKYGLFTKGDSEANINIVLIAFDKIKETVLKKS